MIAGEAVVLRLADGASLTDLGAYAARARSVDADGAMRLQAVGGVLAAWVAPLEGEGLFGEGAALGLRTFALAEPAVLDVTVPVASIPDRTRRMRGAVGTTGESGAELSVPPMRLTPRWAALSPPRAAWEPAGDLDADVLATIAREGIEEIAAAVRERGAAAGFTRKEVWERTVADAGGEIRAGGAFAAYVLGFLAPGTIVTVHRTNRWTRLSAAGGYVLMR